MSVAFRRESDEEHLEPKFERPIPPGPNLVTARGLRLIEARVAYYEAIATPDDEAKRDLRYWRQRLATARLAPPAPADEAVLGSRVHVRQAGKVRQIDIVGEDEAEPMAGRIAVSSPLAQALLGAGPGDKLDFAGRVDVLELLSLEPIPEN